ncbi:hypothetical protein HK097_001052 [Rhizophlyctis rosea]|uniref:Uncharacterized protein n=1 Tax=Rhizophlyctis rosea TaxID=64517 RepID=A0AAD5SH64_9FUNG|nr:hypothetical protein HK097_001052 [Rhizophlyctis rosea]
MSSILICTRPNILLVSPDVDLVLQRAGQTFKSKPISFLIDSNLNPDGTIHVLPTLHIPFHPHIFALGDINDLCIKTVRMAIPQVDVITENIVSLAQGKEATAVVPASGAGIHLTLGTNREAFCMMETQSEGSESKVERVWDSSNVDKNDFYT